jgi:hypothetical protein
VKRLPGAGSEERPAPHVRRFARQCYPTSKGFQRAVIRGFYARLAGRTRDENPYRGRASHRGASRAGGTFTFAWRAAWERGWRYGGR